MRSLLLAVVVFAAACGSSSDNSDAGAGVDMSIPAGPDMELLSRCGEPGDTGNSKGVGKFCTLNGPDCGGNGMATLCSALANGSPPSTDDTYFCSFTCAPSDPAGFCGENAACLCNSTGGCACIPLRCVHTDAGQ